MLARLTRLIPKNLQNQWNPRKIITVFLHKQNSLGIMPQLTLMSFHGFSQSKITPILLSANSAFSFMIIDLKTNLMDCGYSAHSLVT